MLVVRHQPEVSRLLWRFVRQRADLEDCTQEVFLRVVQALPRWRPQQPFLHWLRRITINVGRDFCRRRATAGRHRVTAGDEAALVANAPDPQLDPAARAAADEVIGILVQLPPDDCALLTLHYLEGLDFAAAGALLGWTAPVTKLRAFRARRRLKKLLHESI